MRRLKTFITLALAVAFAGCTPEENPAGNTDFDVRLDIPAEIVLEADAKSVEFTVVDGKAPKQSDLVILDGPAGQKFCKILSASSQKVSVELYKGLQEGQHKISIQRGAEIKTLGTTTFIISKAEDEGGEEGGTENPPVNVEPAQGSTIYGQVVSEGKGLAGVVVSDGNLVTLTDENGVYQLASSKKHGYVFISVPGGYEVNRESVFPMFYKRIALSSKAERVDFELTPVNQDSFNLLVFGDMHLANINNDRQQFSRFVDDVKAYMQSKPGEKFYGITLGDMTDNRYWVSKDYFFDEYKEDIKALDELPIYHTIGNHDHRKDVGDDVQALLYYNEHIGPAYYSFNIGKVHVVVIDNLDFTGVDTYSGRVNAEQVEWLRKDLAHVSKDTPLFITMHASYYKYPKTTDQAVVKQTNQATKDFNALIETYNDVHLFSAHSHLVWSLDNDNVFEHKSGAVCAAWWVCGYLSPGINLGKDGAPSGYNVVTVNGKDVKWQYKGTDYAITEQFASYDRNTMDVTANRRVPNANQNNRQKYEAEAQYWLMKGEDNEVYINVWNWDPEWKIEVKENYFRLDIQQVTVQDPLYLITTIAKRYNDNDSTEGDKTYNMFKVKATAPDTTLEIKVTDRFGNVYTESMKRPKAFEIETYKRY